mmetsp:Transcript_12709/g.35877  ORF Transcript_12709/g.35877 Transcript_12709/m.35877 type:complete len:180 (-) Transcript_12709:84-623(-)
MKESNGTGGAGEEKTVRRVGEENTFDYEVVAKAIGEADGVGRIWDHVLVEITFGEVGIFGKEGSGADLRVGEESRACLRVGGGSTACLREGEESSFGGHGAEENNGHAPRRHGHHTRHEARGGESAGDQSRGNLRERNRPGDSGGRRGGKTNDDRVRYALRCGTLDPLLDIGSDKLSLR